MTRARTTRGGTIGPSLEELLWNTADQLRGHIDAAEYKHVVLPLIFLKYVSDSFQLVYNEVAADEYSDPEDVDEYTARGVFWVPREARWDTLKAGAKQDDIGKQIDDAMKALERENPRQLGDMLPKNYSRPSLPPRVLSGLIDKISEYGTGGTTGAPTAPGNLFDEEGEAKQEKESDLLGRVYEYMLGRFAAAEGKLGGEFYTPRSVVQTLVELLAPYKGRVYDPACGSGGMFIRSEEFVEAHRGRLGDIVIYGQESNYTTWKLARMNLAIRRIEADIKNGDTFHQDLHPDLRADYVLANPPFNISNWGGPLSGDRRWRYGTPPASNANYAWLQHILYHLAPNGTAGVVLANGSLSSNQSGEGVIRQNMISADKVDCIVAMPGQLFYTTQIPVSLWILANNKQNGRGQEGRPLRDRSGQVLFIDARELGYMRTRVERDLTPDDRAKITRAYHNWRGDGDGEYEDIPGFCKAATIDDIEKNGWVLTPGRYVGAAAKEEDSEPFGEKMARLSSELRRQFDESDRLQDLIKKNLEKLGYGG
ncbi:type I restriction-modification system subunit M [Deinococcus planocerae]|uniref:class I SAM-dependent DNA methyltransferase n=1 Tax=Deinococcus planocerae TaxID=1737569 RepID=UPI000C7F0879|nr:class I SAM-dependent DNA methyltransferase [Deinococcus planocerae]